MAQYDSAPRTRCGASLFQMCSLESSTGGGGACSDVKHPTSQVPRTRGPRCFWIWEQPLPRELQCALTADMATECSLSSGPAQQGLCTTVELPLSRPHVCRLPLPTAYDKLVWLLVSDTLPALEFLCHTEDRAGGEGAVPAASGSDSCIPEPTVQLLRCGRAVFHTCLGQT